MGDVDRAVLSAAAVVQNDWSGSELTRLAVLVAVAVPMAWLTLAADSATPRDTLTLNLTITGTAETAIPLRVEHAPRHQLARPLVLTTA